MILTIFLMRTSVCWQRTCHFDVELMLTITDTCRPPDDAVAMSTVVKSTAVNKLVSKYVFLQILKG